MSEIADPGISAEVRELLARVRANGGGEVDRASPQWEAAREAVLAEMSTMADSVFSSTPTISSGPSRIGMTGGRRGRGARRGGSPAARGTIKLETGTPTAQADNSQSIGSGRGSGRGRGGRGGRPRGSRGSRGSLPGGKRKRTSDNDDDDDDQSSNEKDDTDASETFTPLPPQSRSGRKIFQAAPPAPIPIIKIDGEDAPLPPPISTNTPSAPPKRKGKYRRPPGAAAVCKNCGRGHSPSSNVIVFCDGCNKPWHQYCHDPPIRGQMAQIEAQEWFCGDCGVLREESVRVMGRVSGEGMSLVERRAHLLTLPHPVLVSLLLHASTMHPSLPLFLPSHHTSLLSNPHSPPPDTFLYDDNDPLPYPKAGNGIQLPPEDEDLAILLDDDMEVFSHWILDAAGINELARIAEIELATVTVAKELWQVGAGEGAGMVVG